MRILIDYQGAQGASRFRGIGRYTSSFVKAFLRSASKHECILTLNSSLPGVESIRDQFDQFLPQSRIRTYAVESPCAFLNAANDLRRRISECSREAFFQSLNPDVVVHTTVFEGLMDDVVTSIGRISGGPPTAAIFYDLIPLIYPDEYLNTAVLQSWYREKLTYLRRADLLLCISEASRLEAIEHGLATADNTVNISAAVDPAFVETKPEASVALIPACGINKPFLLYVGSSDARKNLPRLIDAYARLPEGIRDSHQLVLGGAMAPQHTQELQERVRQSTLGNKTVLFTGALRDEEIVCLYRNARGFICPSYHEGFGLPVLEAMHFGVPLVAANTSSLPEVVGLEDALFDPHCVDEITGAIEKVLTDTSFRSHCKTHFRAQTAKFDWSQTAERALAALESRFAPLANKKTESTFGGISRQLEIPLGASGQIAALVTTAPRCPRIYVDTSALNETDSGTGIQRVVRNILTRLPQVCGPHYEIVPIAWSNDGYRFADCVASRILGLDPKDENPIVCPHHGDVFLGLDLNFNLIGHEHFFLNLRNIGVHVYFVVYDLLPILLPDYFVEGVKNAYPKWFRLVSQSDGLIGISLSVANEIKNAQNVFGSVRARPLKIGFFHLGADFTDEAASSVEKVRDAILRSVEHRAFLAVGTVEPRKAYGQIVDAFELLWREGLEGELIIAGKRGWLADDLVRRMDALQLSEGRFHWVEDATDEELRFLYENCACLLAASHGEGFGLPLAEALSFGKTVVARDIPVFREVAGESAAYFSGHKASDLASAIRHATNRSDSFRHASPSFKILSWLQSAEMLWRVIHFNQWSGSWLPPVNSQEVSEARHARETSVRKQTLSLGQRLDAFVNRIEPHVPGYIKTAARKILCSTS